MEDIYVDGVADVMSGPAMTKLNFYAVESVTRSKDGKQEEKRKRSISVAMPTINFLVFLKKTLETVRQNKEALSNDSSLEDIKNTIDDIFSGEK